MYEANRNVGKEKSKIRNTMNSIMKGSRKQRKETLTEREQKAGSA